MNRETSERFPAMLAALSQPTRLKIVEVVAEGGKDGKVAGAIAKAVSCPASTLSFHLKELTQAGMLEPTPEGRFIRYRLKADAFAALGRHVAALGGPAATGDKPRRRKARRRGAQDAAANGKTEGQLSIFGD